jgi:hypothetical protein
VFLITVGVAAGCKGSSQRTKAVSVDAGAAAFDVDPPSGYKPVSAPAPVAGAWEGARQPNGFTPTFSVARRPRPYGTDDQIYVTWKDELLGVLHKKYKDVKILEEGALASTPAGKRIILVVTLPTGGAVPMPLYTYGGMVLTGDTLWEMGAVTSSNLDARSGNISPAGEPEILKALASFRVR